MGILRYINLLIILFFIVVGYSCQKSENVFKKGLIVLENVFEVDRLSGFVMEPEEVSITEIWDVEGILFKKNFLSKEEGKDLVVFFESNGINNYEVMMEIMIISLHRKLNSNNINLEEQIDVKTKYWASIKKCEEERRIKALSYYNEYYERDTLMVYYPVHRELQTAVYYDCPYVDWEFDENKDLIVKGIIVRRKPFWYKGWTIFNG